MMAEGFCFVILDDQLARGHERAHGRIFWQWHGVLHCVDLFLGVGGPWLLSVGGMPFGRVVKK